MKSVVLPKTIVYIFGYLDPPQTFQLSFTFSQSRMHENVLHLLLGMLVADPGQAGRVGGGGFRKKFKSLRNLTTTVHSSAVRVKRDPEPDRRGMSETWLGIQDTEPIGLWSHARVYDRSLP